MRLLLATLIGLEDSINLDVCEIIISRWCNRCDIGDVIVSAKRNLQFYLFIKLCNYLDWLIY